MPAKDLAEDSAADAPQGEGAAFSRRDFVKAAALMTGGLLLTLSRCHLPSDPDLLQIPPNFKRFILIEQSPTVATEGIIVALGSQCPDLKCTLWGVDDQEFQFFESVDQIIDLYVQDGRSELIWLD